MKQLTRKNLDELAKVMPIVDAKEQLMFVGGGDGSQMSPYTYAEYNSLYISGNWKGGYVEGNGYIAPDVVVTADGRVTSSFLGVCPDYIWTEGGGLSGTLSYRGTYLIENGNMNIGCSVISNYGDNALYGGQVLVYVNGTEVLCQTLTTSSSMAYDPLMILLWVQQHSIWHNMPVMLKLK